MLIVRKVFEKLLCRLGFHKLECFFEENCLPNYRCIRKDCGWIGKRLEISKPPPMPPCKKAICAENLKMYILIREDTPVNIVPLIASHTAVGTYKKFAHHIEMKYWFETDLQKTVICKVNAKTFEKSKEYGDYFALTEIHHLELGELGLGFNVTSEPPKFFKFLKLYKIEEK